MGGRAAKEKEKVEEKDFSLKEGQTITVNIGGRRGRRSEGRSRGYGHRRFCFGSTTGGRLAAAPAKCTGD